MNKNNDTFIEFIDPDELIEFIPDENLGKASNSNSEDSVDENEEVLDDSGIEVLGSPHPLKVADSIKEDAEAYTIVKKEDTRGRLATIYTVATLLIFVFVILLSFIESLVNKTSLVTNLTQIIPLISGVLFGTLGFVLGYYFRNDNNERNTKEDRDSN
jgi:uncharacterized membrane protein (DUF485 family)